jgi:hypothetical protein
LDKTRCEGKQNKRRLRINDRRISRWYGEEKKEAKPGRGDEEQKEER